MAPITPIRLRNDVPETNFFFLLAVLHHPLSEAIVRTHTSSFRGGYYSMASNSLSICQYHLQRRQSGRISKRLVAQLIAANDAAASRSGATSKDFA